MTQSNVPLLNRRSLLLAGAGGLVAATANAAEKRPLLETAALRGGIDASEFGVGPGQFDNGSKAFQAMLDKASEQDLPVHLPAGVYLISNIDLPKRVRLSGVSGATRLVYGGDGHLFVGERCERVELEDLLVDGANRWLDDGIQAPIDLRRVPLVSIDACEIIGSGRNGIALEGCGGRIERSSISGAADAAIYAVGSTGLSIVGNAISDCGNGGILVHRWQMGEDATLVVDNRIARVLARNGGVGQFGNGINVFRAGGVIVRGNHIADCAFSAIRSNSGSNLQVAGNSCLRSGETAIYSEFAFEVALISNNIVDGAANGISVVNFNEGGRMAVVTGNVVRNLSTEGPYPADAPGFGVGITVEADTSVTGNVVERAPRYGMHLGWGTFLRNVVATGNVVRGCGEGVAVSVVEGAGSAMISDNIFDDVPGGAVVGHRWSDAVTDDLAKGGASGFGNLTVERNRVS